MLTFLEKKQLPRCGVTFLQKFLFINILIEFKSLNKFFYVTRAFFTPYLTPSCTPGAGTGG